MKKPAADFLLVDVSNSFTKIALASRERVGRVGCVATAAFQAHDIEKILRTRDARVIVVSSVVPGKNREISRPGKKRDLIWVSAKLRLDLRIDYPNPQTIGADRLANAVAGAHLYGRPTIVVDFGTAATFDVVDGRNAYIGGVIAPGIESMTHFLYDRTALLPRVSLKNPRSVVGKSTREAMLAGAVFGYRGLVREILRGIVKEKFQHKDVQTIATGGYAKLMAAGLPELRVVHENLTLEGLRLIGRMNSPRNRSSNSQATSCE